MNFFKKLKESLTGKKTEDSGTSNQDTEKKSAEVLKKGLEKTKNSFFGNFSKSLVGKSKISDQELDSIEETLLKSDIGIETSLKIIDGLENRVRKDKFIHTNEIYDFLKDEIKNLLLQNKKDYGFSDEKPYVIMVVGINGVGKTTTIGKLAHQFNKNNLSVTIGAADTFRAAAIDQLEVWSNRTNAKLIKQKMGSDPASVCFDTLKSAKSNDSDVVIIDTAGRLHNNVNLMNELTKIKKVMSKVSINAPHEVILVLDATTGQNAIEQAKQFSKATEVDCIALTKLDGTAKGGIAIGISDQLNIPIKYIGLGETVNDLQLFDKDKFVDTLFSNEN